MKGETISVSDETDHHVRKKDAPMAKRTRCMSFSSTAMAIGNMPAYVGMDDPTIQVSFSFDRISGCPDEQHDLIPIVQQLLTHERLSGIPRRTDNASFKSWQFQPMDEAFDPMKMIRVVQISCEGNVEKTEAFKQLRSVLLRDKQRNLPWWEFVLFKNEIGESALILRVDHAIGDGLSVGGICTDFITNSNGEQIKSFVPESMMKTMASRKRRRSSVCELMLAAMKIAALPLSLFDHKTEFAKKFLKKNLVVSKNSKLITFPEIPIDFIKSIKNATGVSLNDVILTVLSQSIHDFCVHHECEVIERHGDRTRFRALVLAALPREESVKCTNSMSPFSVDLDLGSSETIENRLITISKRTALLKKSPIVPLQLAIVNKVLPFLPLFIFRQLSHRLVSRHSLTYTSVPGPEDQVYISGKRVTSCKAAVIGHIHPIFTALTYNGNMSINLVADSEAIPGLEALPNFFIRSMVTLADKYQMDIPPTLQVVERAEETF